jgi:hypothetical protein
MSVTHKIPNERILKLWKPACLCRLRLFQKSQLRGKPRQKRWGFNPAFNKELILSIYSIPGINAVAF